jgi:excisionase family DNA binding protein
MSNERLTTSQAARALGVHRSTLLRWFREGLQEPEFVQVGRIRHRLLSEADLQRCRDWQRKAQAKRASSTNPQTPGEVDEKEQTHGNHD